MIEFITLIIKLLILPFIPVLQLLLFVISGIYQTLYLTFNLPLCYHDWETIGNGKHRCRKCGGIIVEDT
jgi:hypothetical protein